MPIVWGPNPIVTDGLVLYLDAANPRSYPGNGNIWYDLSPNHNDFTLYNNPTYDSAGFFNVYGPSAYARSNNTLNLTNTNKITVFSIFQVTQVSQGMIYEHTANWNTRNFYSGPSGLISYGGFGFVSHSNGNTDATNTCHIQLNGNSSYARRNIFNSQLSTLESYHVIHDFSQTGNLETNVYVNGTSAITVATDQNPTNTSFFGNDYFYLWARGGVSVYSYVKFKSIAIYDRVLSESEILQNHKSFEKRYGI